MEEKKSGAKAAIVIIIVCIVTVLAMICLCGAIALAIFYPASVRYNEKARESADRNAINEVYVAGQVVLNDSTYASATEKSDRFEIRVDRYGEIKAYDASGDEVIWLEKEVTQIIGTYQLDFKSKQYQSMTSDLIFTYKKNDSGAFETTDGDIEQLFRF